MREAKTRLLLLLVLLLALAGCGSPARKSLILYVSWMAPAIGKGALYVFDALSGSEQWAYQSQAAVGSPFLVNGVVYFGAADQKLYALRANDGFVLWRYKTASASFVARANHGVIYAGTSGFFGGGKTAPDAVYALNAADGSLKWRSPMIGALVAASDDTLYLKTADQKLYALRASDGATRWQFQAETAIANVNVLNRLVYLSSAGTADKRNDAFYALNASDGALVWRYPGANSAPAPTLLALGKETVYLAESASEQSGRGHLVTALNARNGALRWQYQLQETSAPLSGVEDQDSFYLATMDGQVSALNVSDGSVRWHVPTPGPAPQSALALQVNNGFIGVLRDGAGFSMLNASDGSVDWYNQFVSVSFFEIRDGLIYMGFVSSTRLYTIVAVYQAVDGSELWHVHLALGPLDAVVG